MWVFLDRVCARILGFISVTSAVKASIGQGRQSLLCVYIFMIVPYQPTLHFELYVFNQRSKPTWPDKDMHSVTYSYVMLDSNDVTMMSFGSVHSLVLYKHYGHKTFNYQ